MEEKFVLRRVRIKLEGREPDALRKVGLHYKLYNVRVSLWWTGSSTFIFVRLQVLYHIYLSSTYSRIKSRSHFSPGFFCFPHMPSSWFQLWLYGISYENSLRWKVSLLVLQNNCLILILPSFSRCPGPSCCPPPAGASRSDSFPRCCASWVPSRAAVHDSMALWQNSRAAKEPALVLAKKNIVKVGIF